MRWSRSSMFAILAVALSLLAALSANHAAAQDASVSNDRASDPIAASDGATEGATDRSTGGTREDAAREAFVAGSQAADRQLWADSERHFARAYALSGVPAALFNRAVALRNLGREREARRAFDRIVRETEVDEPTRARAVTLRDEAASRIVTLVVVGLEAGASHEVEVDGELRVDTGSRPLRLEVDPGACALEIGRPEHDRFRWRGVVAAGEEHVVRATLVARAVRRGRGWIAAIVGVVVVGALVGVAVGVTRRDGAEPIQPMSGIVLRVD